MRVYLLLFWVSLCSAEINHAESFKRSMRFKMSDNLWVGFGN